MRCSLSHNQVRPQRSGMTLVEVVAGLALLASVGVGSVMAFGLHQRQIIVARQTIEAAQIADNLLSRWQTDSIPVPTLQSGTTGQPGWFWQTQLLRTESLAGLPVQVVRLDILVQDKAGNLQPRAAVEVLVPLKQSGDA